MNDQVEDDLQSGTAKKEETVAADEDQTARTAPVNEWVKSGQDAEIGRVVDEILRGRQAAAVYIDARSGGVFFGAEAHISGDVVGREQQRTIFHGPGGGQASIGIGSIVSILLDKINTVYVSPPLFAQATAILQEKHLLILWGQAHWGKWTTALHLLTNFHKQEVFEISPEVDWNDLRRLEWETNRGYGIDTLAFEQAGKLTKFNLQRLGEQLQKHNSRLVITVDSQVTLPKDILNHYALNWREIPEQSSVLSNHLKWYSFGDKALHRKVEEVYQDAAVQNFLKTHLLPADVDRLADLLTQVARGEIKLEEALARFAVHARQQVAAWFDDHAKLEDRSLMISVAVLNGASYNSIVELDERLQTLIAPPTAETKTPTGVDYYFGQTIAQRIQEVCSHFVSGFEETEFGSNPIKRIELDNPVFQPAVLYHVWHAYGRLHHVLLTWLQESGQHANFDVRVRVAAAVGELSKYDFGNIRRNILLPWANHQDKRMRRMAAFALGIPIWDGVLAPQVLGLLHHWSTLTNNWRLCWTAAVAYGGLVGIRFPDTALRDLHLIARLGDIRLLGVLSGSMAALFQIGELADNYYTYILNALLVWTETVKNNIAGLTGLVVYLNLAANSQIESEPDAGKCPTLLWLSQDEQYSEAIVTLWRRALNTKSTRKQAAAILHQWLIIVNEDMRLYAAIEQIMLTIAPIEAGRERKRVCFYLRRWAENPQGELAVAAKLLAKLCGKELNNDKC